MRLIHYFDRNTSKKCIQSINDQLKPKNCKLDQKTKGHNIRQKKSLLKTKIAETKQAQVFLSATFWSIIFCNNKMENNLLKIRIKRSNTMQSTNIIKRSNRVRTPEGKKPFASQPKSNTKEDSEKDVPNKSLKQVEEKSKLFALRQMKLAVDDKKILRISNPNSKSRVSSTSIELDRICRHQQNINSTMGKQNRLEDKLPKLAAKKKLVLAQNGQRMDKANQLCIDGRMKKLQLRNGKTTFRGKDSQQGTEQSPACSSFEGRIASINLSGSPKLVAEPVVVFSLLSLKQKPGDIITWARANSIGFNITLQSNIEARAETLIANPTINDRPFKPIEDLVRIAKNFIDFSNKQVKPYDEPDYCLQLIKYSRESLLRSFNARESEYEILPSKPTTFSSIPQVVKYLRALQTEDPAWRSALVLIPIGENSIKNPWKVNYSHIEFINHHRFRNSDMKQFEARISQSKFSHIIITISTDSNSKSEVLYLKQMNQSIKTLRKQTDKKIIFFVNSVQFCSHHYLDLQTYQQIDFAYVKTCRNLGGVQSCNLLISRKSYIVGSNFKDQHNPCERELISHNNMDHCLADLINNDAFIGYYRAALSFQLLHDLIGYDTIEERYNFNRGLFIKYVREGNEQLLDEGVIALIELNNYDQIEESNFIPFSLELQKSQKIDYKFASLVLLDIFGLQVGYKCPVPATDSKNIASAGYLYVNVNFLLEPFQIEYFIECIILVTKHYKKLLAMYYDYENGQIHYNMLFSRARQPNLSIFSQTESGIMQIQQSIRRDRQWPRGKNQALLGQLRLAQSIAKNPASYLQHPSKPGYQQKGQLLGGGAQGDHLFVL